MRNQAEGEEEGGGAEGGHAASPALGGDCGRSAACIHASIARRKVSSSGSQKLRNVLKLARLGTSDLPDSSGSASQAWIAERCTPTALATSACVRSPMISRMMACSIDSPLSGVGHTNLFNGSQHVSLGEHGYPPSMDDLGSHLGRTLKELRGSKGLSLRALADLIGVQFTTISYWERGKVTSSSLDSIVKALDALGAGATILVHPNDRGVGVRVEARQDPMLDEFAAALPELDDIGRELVRRALRLALPRDTEGESASHAKKLA